MTSDLLTNPVEAATPPPLSPGGRSAIRTLLVVTALLVTAFAVIGVGGAAWGISSLRIAADTETLPADMKSLTIDTGTMTTAIRITSDRNVREPRVRMRLLNTAQNDRQALKVTRDGGTVGLTVTGTPSPLFDFGPPGEITVTVPPDVAHRLSVTTKQESGVLLTQTQIDQLTVHSTDAAVVLGGDARRIEIHTQSGDVQTREPIAVSDAFVADTVDGHIAADFRDTAPRTVQATSRDSDIDIALPPVGPYLVRAQAGEDAKVRVPQTDDASRAVAQVTARTNEGNIVITTRR
ncbi:DUF4097 domain-containing protein [Mycobacterium sp. CBMA293]|uniref:DUF4097 family beta strand repeat-containing protein n=1 Tax=unclassified Mycolicibacterium TaxID=2636767 RepID=UPI00132281CC|nr:MULTISPECIES: DUF4097 family beta strand repeat-containing protein [unclassified Mycolicibacterium]MUL49729.1 DUF4097 domain-containing protein [Mycolicibacterium sp. CBMA 360]MUL95059.1 DUF4097 domain-containing protein [Mycolicibacterium sp. CBMA 230]MUL62641.1 DUF4097 domain-containing protein [Mycolicibacterium sp. CBMA 335]MUL72540.1 DUF4097 domain-containing protein [Mycolicibacterium sp. CBMA 311]MUM04083.1 hypothetical protein [Mycolicibacterium sp. CBMA 213]